MVTIIQHLLPKPEWAISWAQNRNTPIRSIAITFRAVSFIGSYVDDLVSNCQYQDSKTRLSLTAMSSLFISFQYTIHTQTHMMMRTMMMLNWSILLLASFAVSLNWIIKIHRTYTVHPFIIGAVPQWEKQWLNQKYRLNCKIIISFFWQKFFFLPTQSTKTHKKDILNARVCDSWGLFIRYRFPTKRKYHFSNYFCLWFKLSLNCFCSCDS